MKILALDLATKTGWAHTDGESGVWHLPSRTTIGDGNGWRYACLNNWLKGMIAEHKPEAVVYELAHHRGGPATRLANGMIATVEQCCCNAGVKTKGYHSATIKKHATGKGNAKKPEMYAAALKRNPDRKYLTDDEVDAVWLLDLALSELTTVEPLR